MSMNPKYSTGSSQTQLFVSGEYSSGLILHKSNLPKLSKPSKFYSTSNYQKLTMKPEFDQILNRSASFSKEFGGRWMW